MGARTERSKRKRFEVILLEIGEVYKYDHKKRGFHRGFLAIWETLELLQFPGQPRGRRLDPVCAGGLSKFFRRLLFFTHRVFHFRHVQASPGYRSQRHGPLHGPGPKIASSPWARTHYGNGEWNTMAPAWHLGPSVSVIAVTRPGCLNCFATKVVVLLSVPGHHLFVV